jgi:hypothetical protein
MLSYHAPLSREAVFVSVCEVPGFLRTDAFPGMGREKHKTVTSRYSPMVAAASLAIAVMMAEFTAAFRVNHAYHDYVI